MTESRKYDDPRAGASYKFDNGTTDRVSLFIYPIGPDVRSGDDPRTWVASEAKKFKDIFPAGVQRGWWQTYEVAFDNPDSVTAAGAQLPGYVVAGGTRRGSVVIVELQYLYAVCDRFVKIRGTLADTNWQESLFPAFAKDLAAYLKLH